MKKREFTLCFIVIFKFLLHFGDRAEVSRVEREAHWASMNTVLGSSVAFAVFLAGGISVFLGLVLISMRRALSLCE
jgi:hypothetical protein